MSSILKLVLLFAVLSNAALWGQGTAITLTLSGNANATPVGANFNFSLAGNGSVTGLGNATLSGAGVIDSSTVLTLGSISGTFTLIFTGTDVMVGTFSIPAGVIVPSIGNSSAATGTAKIIGGTGKFTGATGSFTGLTGTGTATGATSTSFQLAGTGTLGYSGSIAHLASGAGWKTTMTFANTGTTAAQLHLTFFGDDGQSLLLPVTFPQSATTPAAQVSTLDRTINAGSVLIIESEGGTTLQIGSAQVTTDAGVTGSAIFRYTPSGQEAVVPLETRNPAAFALPFDNTTGLANGLAVANISTAAAAIRIIITDDTGVNTLVNDILNLPARGHVSFVLTDRYSVTRDRRGTITLQTPANGQISALGIRATTAGAYTSIPPGVK